ncbi:MATE family efflux transporter [Adlercreutzia equolifaciens]|uniref:MATE family efflux transporter n=1 Tax=Adlercreutzia equolifaciens TaxID=446660 RepID=UPI0023AEF525|nr:MATE family efflux transporter [Adlercreutzia equolifaciens]MDE8702331.1 MATE family efflux transporter [Adlercreutzia equolifaciens]
MNDKTPDTLPAAPSAGSHGAVPDPRGQKLHAQSTGDDKVMRMGTASIPRLITEFAIPSVVGMLINGSYAIIDSMFLGHAVGEIGLSAMTVANPIMIVFMAIAMLIGNGGNALAALRLGEGKREDAERALGNVVAMSLVAAVVVLFVGWNPALVSWVLDVSSATPDVRPYAQTFIQIICAGFILQCIGLGVNNFIRTCGAPNRALGTMVIGLVGSVAFNALFVLGLGWGVFGSALATVLGWACSCLAVLQYFCLRKDVPMRLRLPALRLAPSMDATILAFGLPSFCVQAGMAVVNFFINFQLVKYGALSPIGSEDALAAIGVVQRIAQFSVMPLVGTAIALQPLLGFNYGARNVARVRKTLWYGIGAATSLALVMFLIVEVFATPIAHAFGISHDGLADFTAFAIRVQFLMLPFVGFQIVSSNYFQATGQPAKSVFLTLTRQILFLIPLLYLMPLVLPQILPQFNGLDALYFATPVADLLSIVVTAVFVAWEMRRLHRMQQMFGK